MVTRQLNRTADATRVTTDNDGELTLRPEVVARIAGIAAAEVDDVCLSSMPGIMSLLIGAAPDRNARVRRAVRANLDGARATVDLWLKVQYGRPIPQLVADVRRRVRDRLEEMAAVQDVRINVHVTDMLLPTEEQAAADET